MRTFTGVAGRGSCVGCAEGLFFRVVASQSALSSACSTKIQRRMQRTLGQGPILS